MKRPTSSRRHWPARRTDTVTLLFDDRYRRRLRMLGDGGLDFLLDLVEPVVLHSGDGLEAGGGRLRRGEGGRGGSGRDARPRCRGLRAARLASRQPPSAGADRRRPHPDPRRSRDRRHAEGPGRRGPQGARAVRSRRRRLRPAQSRPRPSAMATSTTSVMAEARADPLYRLLAWLSPAYPIGAFSYSHGVETAVEEGFIKDRASLVAWLESVLRARHRPGRRRAVRRGVARGRGERTGRRSMPSPNARRRGAAPPRWRWNRASRAARSCRSRARPGRIPLSTRPTSGRAASSRCRSPWRWRPRRTASRSRRRSGGYLHAFAANLISAAVRTVPLGQTDGQRALAALEPRCDGPPKRRWPWPRSTRSARRRRCSTGARCATKRSTRGCSAHECRAGLPAVRRRRRPCRRPRPVGPRQSLARGQRGGAGARRRGRWPPAHAAALAVLRRRRAVGAGGAVALVCARARIGAGRADRYLRHRRRPSWPAGWAGYSPRWRGHFNDEPFARRDKRYYSPYSLLLGVGYLALLAGEMER